jgi:endonuclease YncB( thermonuclease family)
MLATFCNACFLCFQGMDVGSRLVELGFARVVPPEPALSSSEALQKLYKRLSKSEKRAVRNGNGIWWGQEPLYVKLANRTCSKLRLMAVKTMPAKLSDKVALR